MAQLLYRSTNRRSPSVTFREALLRGQAPDRGLYVPEFYPIFNRDFMASMRDMSYPELAANVMKQLVGDCLTLEELRGMCDDAYTFDVPVEAVNGRDGRYVMRLDRGPTASFKDFAAQMMGRMVPHYLQQEGKELVILTATSGDTGSAVAQAFYNKPRVKMVVLFPEQEITDRQRKLMTTLGSNITAVSVNGKFDDCQAMVKTAFSDDDLKYLPLSSANSINVGRLIPQAVYYFHAYGRVSRDGGMAVFSVPSGNFGDLTAGLIARGMGLPAKLYIAAVNENDEFPRFLETGNYEKIAPSRNCISNAMNVGHPSNLARIVDMFGGHMDNDGAMTEKPRHIDSMRRQIKSASISDELTRDTIRRAWEEHNLLLEPHGAVGWAALEEIAPANRDGLAYVSIETAHPAKFPEVIMEELGFEPDIPASMRGLDDRPESYDTIPAEYGALKELLRKRF
ncbi:MAG: threonine synthase [Candidatus Aenigmarchaeota archaeon]|nr:threonine synthase [Candidatus Aenigmarchaeota archaeon]